MNNLVRFILVLLSLSLIVSLAGCGGEQSNFNQGSGAPPSPPPPPPPPPGTPTFAFLSQIRGTGNYQISLMTDNGGVISVASPDKFNYVRLSSDGKKIVYSLADANGFYFSIGIMNSDGSGKTPLTATNEFDLHPQFTPDGSKIIYQSWRGHGYVDVILMNADGTNTQNLTHQSGSSYYEPTVSPDGKTIAASFCSPSACGLATMNIDGSRIQIIQTCDAYTQFLSEPTFSADSSKIFFTYVSTSPPDIYVHNIYLIDADGANLTQLTNSSYDGTPMGLGDKVLFVSCRDSQKHDWFDFEIYSMNPDGSEITRLTNNTTYDGFVGYLMFGMPG